MRYVRNIAAVGVTLLPMLASAAVPTELSDLQTDLLADAATVVGYSVALLAATFGTFWIIGLFKKAVNKGK